MNTSLFKGISKKYGYEHYGTEGISRLAVNSVLEIMKHYYPSDENLVDDIVFHRNSIRLCEQTAKYLYEGYTSCKINYRNGSRPFLEKIVNENINPDMTEKEKIMLLLRFVRDLPDRKKGVENDFIGGTEEEIIMKSSDYCGEQARLLACLAQIAGMPSRLIGHFNSFNPDGTILYLGHGGNEIMLDGRFVYVDIRGIVIERSDGKLASAYDLMLFPEMIDRQLGHILKNIRPNYSLTKTRERFLSQRNITLVSNYFINDRQRYNYKKIPLNNEFEYKYQKIQDKYKRKFQKMF